MNEWIECLLEDVAVFQRGYDLPKTEMKYGNIPVAGSNGIIGYHDKATTKGPGITIGRSGNIGTPKYYENDFWAHNTVLYVKDFKGNDERFVYYFLNTFDFSGFNAGSAVPTLNRNHIHELIVRIPPISEQKAIASVLTSIDDKIDLLHRQNKTLEEIAETLFRKMIKEDENNNWEEKALGSLVQIRRGGSPRPIHEFISDSGYNWLKISDVTNVDSPFIFNIKECIIEEGLKKTVFLKKGSLVLSNSATPGIPKILAVDSCIHDGWLYFPESYFSNEFLYLLFRKIQPELLQQGNGSIFTNLKTDILKEFIIRVPDKNTLKIFQLTVYPLFNKIYHNTVQILLLEQLRDTLLPKLMSGEIKIKQEKL